MKRFFTLILVLISMTACNAAFNQETGTISNERWQSGVPLGGIGCGKLEILTDGGFGFYTGNNNWDRPTGRLRGAFFAVYAQSGEKKAARMLRLRNTDEYTGIQSITGIDYSGWFPTADLKYVDKELPAQISLHAWSPLIPNNIADSSLPAASFSFTVTNPNKESMKAVILMSWPNMVGYGGNRDVKWDDLNGNIQTFSRTKEMGVLLYAKDGYTTTGATSIGKYALCASTKGADLSYVPAFDSASPDLPFWGSFSENGTVRDVSAAVKPKQPAGALMAAINLKPNEIRKVEFILVWHFPDHINIRKEMIPSHEAQTSVKDVQFAIDNDPATRWATGRRMIPGDAFTLDLGTSRRIAKAVLDSKLSGSDYPQGYRIELSDDGSSWRTAAKATAEQASTQQSSGILNITFAEQNARFVRIVQTGESMSWFWSIHELELYDSAGTRISTADAKASASLTKYKTKETRSNIGHFYSRRFVSAVDIARYVSSNRDRLLSQTKEWQNQVRSSNLPSWLKIKMINSAFSVYACSILTKDGRFAVQESPVDMWGSTGTMDQRMAAHAFWTQMFPELDEIELRLFAKCQDLVKPVADGRITHFNGNIHEVIGDPNVSYGITDWPDLSCSWVMQVAKLYKWTNDRKFADDMWPHVKRAMAWLKTADTDGDQIPEGGSTYDYETLPRGAFSYTASCYLGALRTSIDMAKLLGDKDSEQTYEKQFAATQKSLMASLWNGKYFAKHLVPAIGQTNPNSFIAQLAGDWLSRLTATGRTLSPEVTESVVCETIARHVKPFYPLPPMETTPDGKLAFSGCYALQHEPYLGCEAIYEGYTDDGLEVIKRIYDVSWLVNHNPWQQPLAFQAPSGEQGGLVSYMTCPTTWHVLNALSGVTLDLPRQTIYVSPRVGESLKELHMPVYLSKFWLWIDYVPGRILKLKVMKNIGAPVSITQAAPDDGRNPVKFSEPLIMKEGEVLDLSKLVEYFALNKEPKVVDYEMKFQQPQTVRPGIPTDGWTSDSGHGQDPYAPSSSAAASYDNNADTRWSTNASMQPADWMTIDMRKVHRLTRIVLDATASPNDFPRGCTVLISTDGTSWSKAAELTEADCQSRVSKGILEIGIASSDARYVKIIQNGSVPGTFWSVHEIYLYE
ncbi:MAG: GH116 family glycosyl-hydrolase [Armatimonadota bacterium]